MEEKISNEEKTQKETKPESTASETKKTCVIKEYATPLAIVVAGIFVAGGLYFGSGPVEPEVINPIHEFVEIAGVKTKAFDKCMEEGEVMNIVEKQYQNAIETGGRGTPMNILIGPGGKKYSIPGAYPQEAIEQIIETAKAEADQGPGGSEEELVLENMLPLTADDNVRGSLDADIIIVEYSDFDCPYCKRFHETMKSVYEKYEGEIAWVYRHFPLEQLHPNTKSVAAASECVAEIGGDEAFWKFADAYSAQ